KKTLEKAMTRAALEGMEHADIVLHLVDAAAKDPFARNADIIRQLPKGKPCHLVLNKVDTARRAELLALAAAFNGAFSYERTYMVSGLNGSGLKDVVKDLAETLPAGTWLFPEDQVTDMPLRLLAA